jgi:hypothetical protein
MDVPACESRDRMNQAKVNFLSISDIYSEKRLRATEISARMPLRYGKNINNLFIPENAAVEFIPIFVILHALCKNQKDYHDRIDRRHAGT